MIDEGIKNFASKKMYLQMALMNFSARSMSNKVLLPERIGIVGAGQMGTGIAVVGAMNAKLPVLLMDANDQSLTKSINFISLYSLYQLLLLLLLLLVFFS